MSQTPIQQLIAKLPTDLQPWAQTYIQFVAGQTLQQLTDWINLILAGNWEAAYKQVVETMTPEQLAAELDRINANLEFNNVENVAQMATQKALISNLFSILIAAAQTSIGL